MYRPRIIRLIIIFFSIKLFVTLITFIFFSVGCDGTNVNTGWRNGVITLLEKKLRRPLQHAVCLLHINELPLRHLIIAMDGPTTGVSSFSGPIGKEIQTCHEMEPVSFEAIKNSNFPSVPESVISKLSNDQRYILEITYAVMNGSVSERLKKLKPGPVNHSRWLTTASRILRYYVSVRAPSVALKRISFYIVHIYVPIWFCIKKNELIHHGAKHFLKLVSLCNSLLTADEKSVVFPVLKQNAYYAHSENILVSMLSEENLEIRMKAYDIIRNDRAIRLDPDVPEVRTYKNPAITCRESNYDDMIRQNEMLYQPPVVRDIPLNILRIMIDGGPMVFDFPCHSQNVEAIVQCHTKVSLKASGALRRDGYMRTTLSSRSVMPSFKSKRDFN